MLTKEKLIGQYGKENVRFASNFSEHSKNLPPGGFMVKVKRTDVIKKPPPFNTEELFSGVCLVEIPPTYKSKPKEQWSLDKEKLFGGLDGSSVHVVTNQMPDKSGHQLVKRKFIAVRAGIPTLANEACHDIEKGLMANPPKEYTWERFFTEKQLFKLRTEAVRQRMQIARDFLVGTGMCSQKEADALQFSDDVITHDIALKKGDDEHFYVCSGAVMPFKLTRCMIFYEGPALGFRVFTGEPDSTLFGKGMTKPTSGIIPSSFGLQNTDRFSEKKKSFAAPLGDGQSVFHYMDAYKPFNEEVLQEARVCGRDPSWSELILRPTTGLIA